MTAATRPEPLLFLPGMMCDARQWAPQIAAFSGVHMMAAAPLAAADSIGGLADAVLEQAPPRFALAGLSMGGIVAMQVAARAPARVTRLALLDTNPRAETPEVAARRSPQMAAVAAGGLRAVMRDEMKPNYLAPGARRGEILDLCMAMAEGLGADVFLRQSRALRSRPDQRGALPRITCPTLVLMGEADTLCPRDRHEEMAALIPGARLHIIPGAGHLPPLEQPELTNEALSTWLNTCSPNRC